MSKDKGTIFVVAAPSGAGKTTIVRQILKIFPQIVFSISATTRKKRDAEQHGVDYFFLSEEDFKRKIEEDEFVEWERFYDYYYGTLKSFINAQTDAGKPVLLEVDVKGALNIKKIYPESVLIYIMPPGIEELKQRLLNRNTETEEDFKKRIERAEMELSLKDNFDYIVVNNKLDVAIEEVKKIIEIYLN